MKRKFTVLGLVIACVIGLSGCLSTNQPVEKTNNIVQNKDDKDFFDYAFNHSKCYTEDNMNDCIKGINENNQYSVMETFTEEGFRESDLYYKYRIYQTIFSDHACALKNAEACYITYSVIDSNFMDDNQNKKNSIIDKIMGHDIEFRRNMAKASLFKSCELNFARACETLAHLKHFYYLWEDQLEKNSYLRNKRYITDNIVSDEMLRYAKKACDLDSRTCETLSKIYYVKKDEERSKYYHDKFCKVVPDKC